MNTPWSRNRFRSYSPIGIAAALTVAAMTTLGHGQARSPTREAARSHRVDLREVNKRLPAGQRVLYVEPPLTEEDYVLPPRLAHRADQIERMPAGIPLVNILQLDDASIAGGAVAATFTLGDPMVYLADTDSNFFVPNKSDDGNFEAGQLIFEWYQFTPGGVISAYEFVVFNSDDGPSGQATVVSQLWTGDPLSVLDTTCGDPATSIAGTACTFTGIPDGAASP